MIAEIVVIGLENQRHPQTAGKRGRAFNTSVYFYESRFELHFELQQICSKLIKSLHCFSPNLLKVYPRAKKTLEKR
jgi:hypothetical protein